MTPVPANPEALSKMRQRIADAKRAIAERAVVPYKPGVPVAEGAWDGPAAEAKLRKWASSDGSGDKDKVDWVKYREGFAWYDADNPEHFGSFKLPHHTIDGGTLDTLKEGVIAAGNALMGSRGGVKIPDGDLEGVKAHLAKHYRQFDMAPPWEPKKASPPAERGGDERQTDMDEKEKAALEAKVAAHEKTIRDTESRATAAEARATALTDQNATLVKERDAALARATAAETVVVEREVDALVGKKFLPAEREKQLELAKKDVTLFRELAAQRADLKLDQTVIPPVDKGTPPTPAGADPLADINAQALKAAHGG